MALILKKPTRLGVDGEYWVASFHYDGIAKEITVHTYLFLSEASRKAGNEFADHKAFIYKIEDLPEIENGDFSDCMKAVYEKIKLESHFQNAQDKIEEVVKP